MGISAHQFIGFTQDQISFLNEFKKHEAKIWLDVENTKPHLTSKFQVTGDELNAFIEQISSIITSETNPK